MIDLHAHVLPGVDDGPSNVQESLALLSAMEREGMHLVTATPHLRSDHPGVKVSELHERAAQLDEAAGQAGIGMRVLPGAEVDLLWARSAAPEQLRLATVAQRGTDLLLETPYGPLPDGFGREVERIAGLGLRVLLAHPERNPTFQRHPERVLELVARGVLVQVTAMSLAGQDAGSRSGPLARWLLEHDAVHVIATDAHAHGDWRGPRLGPAIAALTSAAPSRLEWILHEVPQAVVEGISLPPAPKGLPRPAPGRRHSRLVRRLLRRRG